MSAKSQNSEKGKLYFAVQFTTNINDMKSTVINQQNVEYVAFVIPFFDLYIAYFYRNNSNDLTSYIEALEVKFPCGAVVNFKRNLRKRISFFYRYKNKRDTVIYSSLSRKKEQPVDITVKAGVQKRAVAKLTRNGTQ